MSKQHRNPSPDCIVGDSITAPEANSFARLGRALRSSTSSVVFVGALTAIPLLANAAEVAVKNVGANVKTIGVAELASTNIKAVRADEVTATKVKIIGGEKYSFTKHVDKNGGTRTEIRDADDQLVDEEVIRKRQFLYQSSKYPEYEMVVDERVLDALRNLEGYGDIRGRYAATIRVNVALEFEGEVVHEVPESGGVEEIEGEITQAIINRKLVSPQELKRYDLDREDRLSEMRQLRAARQTQRMLDWAWRFGLQNHEGMEAALSDGSTNVTLDLTPMALKDLIYSRNGAIVGIELHEPSEDDINQAMADTSISTSALPYASTRGNGIGIYMTESGCANESRFSNYDRLSGSETNHSRNVGGILRTVSPGSFLYCRGSAVLPQISDLDGVGSNPRIYVVTRSNSNNDNTSYTTVDRSWDNFVYNWNVPVFNSGGNTGNGTGNVRSPGKGLNVTTVGNYNDANNTISSSSPFVDPQTGNDKPEVAAPGVNITAGGFTMSGTSMSTPHAAAFSADMMSHSTYLKYRPYLLKAKLLAGATDPITGGYSKVGLGGIDFASAQWSGYWQWYSGGNSSFSYFDQQDGSTNGYVEKQIYISGSWNKARVVLSWLNRGSYTYSHRNDAHPIGMDLDLRVYDPYGNYVGGSYSWDNPFERVNFTPTVSGYYTFKINRYANRDTSSSLRMGLYVNYYN